MSTLTNYSPFIGITFDGVHSSTLGLYRVGDGSRYNENLLPVLTDRVAERPNGDGVYFFGSNFQQKNWTLDFAFDNVTQEQLDNIMRLFGAAAKEPKKLIFDEHRDYEEINDNGEPAIKKYYLVKVMDSPILKTICFDEKDSNGDTIEVYKGELSVEVANLDGLGYKGEKTLVVLPDEKSATEIDVQNKGVERVYPTFYISKVEDTENTSFTFSLLSSEEASEADLVYSAGLVVANLNFQDKDNGLVIDCEKGLVWGSYNGTKTSNIYNGYISSGYFFGLPVNLTSAPDKIYFKSSDGLYLSKAEYQERVY